MHTKDILARELTKAGLSEMAAKAAIGDYHDFLSPLARLACNSPKTCLMTGPQVLKAKPRPRPTAPGGPD